VKRLIGHVRSNAIAYVALFLALGGTSYAAIKIPAKSVGTKQLKNNAVTGAKVKNGSLLVADLKAGQLQPGAKGDKGDTGPQGLQGVQGTQGPQGDKGDAGSGGGTPIDLNQGDETVQSKPVASPSVTTSRDTVFTTSIAKSMVISSGFIQVDYQCAAGTSCQFRGGLYLDGAPVPGTAVGTASSPINVGAGSALNDQKIAVSGRIGDIAPGQHHLRLAFAPTSGNLTVNVDGGSGSVLVVPQP
jgi:hypothetical protein